MVLRHSKGMNESLYQDFDLPKKSLEGVWLVEFLGNERLKFELILDEMKKISNKLWENINISLKEYSIDLKNVVQDDKIEVIIVNNLGYNIDTWIEYLKHKKYRNLLAVELNSSEIFERIKIFSDIRLLSFKNCNEPQKIAKYLYKLISNKRIVVIDDGRHKD